MNKLFSICSTQHYDRAILKAWGYNGRFWAIFLVICTHFLSPNAEAHPVAISDFLTALNTMTSFFSVPSLTFLAGFFCLGDLSKFRAQQLLTMIFITYFMFNLIVINVYSYNEVFLLEPATMSWFLLSVIYWNCLIVFFENIKYNIAISILIAVVIGCTPKIGEFLSASRCFFFFPFFLVGYTMSKKKVLLTFNRSFSIFSILLIYIITFFTMIDFIPPLLLWGRNSYAELGISNQLGIVARLAYYPCAFLAVFSVLSLVPQKVTCFTPLGKNSLYSYLGHGIVVLFLMDIGFYTQKINLTLEIFLILLAFVVDILMSHDKFKYFADFILRPKFLIKMFFITDELDKKALKENEYKTLDTNKTE